MEFLLILVEVFIWLLLLIAISFFLNRFWGNFLPDKIKRLIIFPGIVIHEISHAIGCIITGAKIKKIAFLSSKGSYVSHSKPFFPLIGNFIISFAPIVGAIISLFFLLRVFGFSISLSQDFNFFYENFIFIFKESIIFVINNYNSWKFWVFLYLALSIVISLSPSKKDFKNSFSSLIFIAIVVFLLLYLGIFSEGIINFLENSVIGFLGLGFFFGLSAIIITSPFYLIKKLI